jgi:carboxymethylenebutenolidase
MVEFPSNGHTVQGYLALPDAGHGPGVVVIQEWWGLVDHIKDVADRLAGEGFVALAPDLYHGQKTDEPDEAQKLMMAMKMDEAARDMAGAVQYLVDHDAADGETVGCVGFCLGGGLSLYLSTVRPEVDAAVVYYGVLPGVQPDLSTIRGAVLGHFAEHDDFANPAAAEELKGRLEAEGVPVEFHIYDGCHHAFFNDTRPEVYNEEAARRSWERTLTFFRDRLG